MIPPVIVTIYGNVSVGKSTWAREIERRASKHGMSVVVSDHNLFVFDDKFEENLKKVRATIEQQNPDFGIIVVGTGLNENPPFRLAVEHQGFGAQPLFDLLFCAEVD